MRKGFKVNEAQTSFEDITNYNNFYEFSTEKRSVASEVRGFITRPWAVEVGGLVNKPKTFDLDDLIKLAPPEERIYRHRCVEGWSMVIPWVGFPLSALLKQVEPLSSANYVAFQTLLDPKRMPNQRTGVLDWPYVEGLRVDEAMNPLAILATGLYGGSLPPQDGAPIRLVVPWKYGFKSIKSIVKITLVAEQPPTTWNIQAPNEYGFYSFVAWRTRARRRFPAATITHRSVCSLGPRPSCFPTTRSGSASCQTSAHRSSGLAMPMARERRLPRPPTAPPLRAMTG